MVDTYKVPAGVKLRRPAKRGVAGFLVRPTTDDPSPVTFTGKFLAVTEKPKKKGRKVEYWATIQALNDQPALIQSTDQKTGEQTERTVKAGDMVGVTISGAIHHMATSKSLGHFVVLEYTGKKISMGDDREDMWEVDYQESDEPLKS
jgi:hypothetical protein